MNSVKIKSIKKKKCKKTPVYDIGVEKYNNFVLENGLVVHNCKPYMTLKSAIYEERLEMYENKLLTEELIGLERNNNGKIDHSPLGINSKDSADAVCGALFNASQHAEQFAFEYGEDLENAVTVNNSGIEMTRQQIEIDMEDILKHIQDPILKNNAKKIQPPDPFGIGTMNKPTTNFSPLYLYEGIIV